MSVSSDEFYNDEVDRKMAVFSITSDEENYEVNIDDVEPILKIGYKRPSMAARVCARVSNIFKRNKNYIEVINAPSV